MELRPSKPEGLVCGDLFARGVDDSDAVASANNLHTIVEFDGLARIERIHCRSDVDGKRRAVCLEYADDVLLNWQAGIDITDWEDWAGVVAAIFTTEIEVTAERKILDQNGGVGVLLDPGAPSRGDDCVTVELDSPVEQVARLGFAPEGVKDRA